MWTNFQIQRAWAIFEGSDRPTGGLPPELEGKSPLEISQYYQEQLRQQRQGGPPTRTDPPPPAPISDDEFATNPADATRRFVAQNTVSRSEYEAMSQAAQTNLVMTAKLLAREGKNHWARFLPRLEELARTANPLDTINPTWWETTYNYLVGQNYETLTSEAEAARNARSSEGTSGPPAPPPVARDLTQTEKFVASGLGFTEDQWRTGEQRKNDGRLPVTLDNRRAA